MNITHNNNCYAHNSSYPQENPEDHPARNALWGHHPSETPLFKRQEGTAQFIIQREGSGQLKAFLEEADGSRFPILLKGFPDRIASNQTETFRNLFAHTPIKRSGFSADFSCGLLGGAGDKRKREKEDKEKDLKIPKITEDQTIAPTSQLDPSRIFFATTKKFKKGLKSSGRTLDKVDGKSLDDPSWSHYEVYKYFYKQLPSTTLDNTQLTYWKILSIDEKLYEREFIAKAIDGKDPLCCFLISQDLKSVDSISFKYFLQNLPYYCNLDAIDNSNNLKFSIAQNIKNCLLKYIDNEALLPRDIQLINDPNNQNSRDIYEAALLNFFDSPQDDDSVLMDKNSKVRSFIQEISFIFFKAAADSGFAPAQYSLSLNCKNLEEEQRYDEILFQDYRIQPAHYFLEALFQGHWEAVRDIQFMGVFDPGLSNWGLFTYKPLELKLSAKIIDHQLQLILKRLDSKVKPSSSHSKDDSTEYKEGFELLFKYYNENKIIPDESFLELTRNILNCAKNELCFSANTPIKIIGNCLDLLYSQMAVDKLQCKPREPLFPFIRNEDNLFYQPKMIYESNILNAQKCIENIKNEDFKKYSYLGLAKLIAGFESLYSGTPNVSELNVEKIVEHFVEKSGNIPELTYYLLIKGAVNKILSPVIPITPLEDASPAAQERYENDEKRYKKEIEDKKFYENKIPEYLSKIGPLGNLAMFEIQKRNTSIQLDDQTSEIRKEFIKKEAEWNKKYYGAASADNERKDFIKDKLIPDLLNWGFSAEYIKTHVFINKFLIEKAPRDQQSNSVLEELIKAIKSSFKDPSVKFDSYFNLNIKPKLILKLNREEQLRHFLDKEKMDKSQFTQNYSLIVKKISKDTIALVKELCENIQQSLGTPPTNFEIFTLGSLARRESGFYTDFEVGIVLQENSIAAQIYFEKFSQKLADSLFMLEEHPDVGMHGAHLDTADNAPPHKRFEFRDFSDDQIMKQIRNAVGYRRKDDIPTAGSRIYLLAAEDFTKLFYNGVLENLDSANSFELSSFHTRLLQPIQTQLLNCINICIENPDLVQRSNNQDLENIIRQIRDLNDPNFQLPETQEEINNLPDGDLKDNLFNSIRNYSNQPDPARDTRIITTYIAAMLQLSSDLQRSLLKTIQENRTNLRDLDWESELLRLAKKEIKRQLVEDYITYKNQPAERLRLTKEALPYVKKILNPLSSGEIGVARSVPDLGRNIDIVYSYTAPGEIKNFDLIESRNNYFSEKILCQNLSIKTELNQGQYISFKAIIELLYNRAFKEKLFADTFDPSMDARFPLSWVKNLIKGQAAKILPKKIDLKRAFYRIPEQILTGLSWFFRKKIDVNNTAFHVEREKEYYIQEKNYLKDNTMGNLSDLFQHYFSIIGLLREAGIFSEDLKREFCFLMNLGVKFRLQQQAKLKGECNEIYLHEETWRKELADQDATIKVLKDSLDRWTCLYRQDSSLEHQNDYTDTLKNYLEALKKKSYLEKVGPDIFSPEEKMLFAQGFHSLKHIVDLTEKWIKNVKEGKKTGGLDGFPNTL